MNRTGIAVAGVLLALGLVLTGCTEWSSPLSMMGQQPGHPGWGQGSGAPISLDQAVQVGQRLVERMGDLGLRLAEVMQFDNHFYGAVEEISTGMHAFEFLMSTDGRWTWPEPGPNMMWNQHYGMMQGGMWGAHGSHQAPFGPMTITPDQARADAQRYLDGAMPGARVGDEVDVYYGYYTMHVEQNGRMTGMLSVNGDDSQVWIHDWHGQFMDMWTPQPQDQ